MRAARNRNKIVFRDALPLAHRLYGWMHRTWNREANIVYRKQNVAIFHSGRCGSTVLGDMLNQHPLIYWANELFSGPLTRNKVHTIAADYVERTINISRSLRISSIYAFETKYLQQQHLSSERINKKIGDYLEILRKLGFTKNIVLHRNNYLRQAISYEVGKKVGKWHSRDQTKSITKVTINVDSYTTTGDYHKPLVDLFRSMDAAYKKLCSLLLPDQMIILQYEQDILEDPYVGYRKVCQFLDIEDASPNITYKRTNPFKCEEMIENYNEVKTVLQNTEFCWMLDN